ncbi:MAG: hypothetical protein E6F93_01190 [Actinobacteria bacterium]|nr:MAG: hypothetical protein E6G21_10415 [Actinomycetota bacterium]TMM35015.1 MAG: hypothetical protein E6F93_01190 [Actinomycetota bacterium]
MRSSTTAEGPIPAQGEQAAYWLRRCQGFRVESDGRRIGIVEDVLYGAEHDRPSALLVRTGMLKRRLEAISLEDVEEIFPRAQRLSLRAVSRRD